MSLLDNVLGALGGGGQGGASPLVNVLLQVLANSGAGAQGGGAAGGLGGLLSQFEQAGLGHVAQSWVGTGANLPISADQILSVLGGGGGPLGQIAAQLGLSHQDAAHQVSQVLPQIVDRLTPQGQLPAAGGLDLGQMLSMLGGLGGAR